MTAPITIAFCNDKYILMTDVRWCPGEWADNMFSGRRYVGYAKRRRVGGGPIRRPYQAYGGIGMESLYGHRTGIDTPLFFTRS